MEKIPAGVNRFLQICNELNIPSSVVNSKLKHEFVRGNIKPKGNRSSSEGIKAASSTTFGWQSFVSDHDAGEDFDTAEEEESQ